MFFRYARQYDDRQNQVEFDWLLPKFLWENGHRLLFVYSLSPIIFCLYMVLFCLNVPYYGLLAIINLLLYFLFFLVFFPNVRFPHLLFGEGSPIPLRPSPPQCGWLRGFWATPRTCGRIPKCLLRPAFPITLFFH